MESELPSIFIIVFIVELSNYFNRKTRANLFIQMKVSKQQEFQMVELLDRIQDHTLICSKKPDGRNPDPLFSNRQMNNLFGRDLVSTKKNGGSTTIMRSS